MPSIKESQGIDRRRLKPVDVDTPSAPLAASMPPPLPASAPSSLMMCSLPNVAASYDQYVRQFYDRGRVPQMRILPVNL